MQLKNYTPYIPTLLYSFCIQALFLLLPLSLVANGHTASLAAMIIGLRGVGLLCTDIPSGYISDKYGNFAGLVSGSALFVLGYAFIVLTENPSIMIVGGIILGVGLSLAQIGRQGFIAFYLTSMSTGKKLSLLGSAVRFGSLLGPLIAALLADHYGYPVAFKILLLVTLISFAVELYILCKSSIPKKPASSTNTLNFKEFYGFLKNNRRIFLTTSGFIFILQSVRTVKIILIPLIGVSLNFSVSSVGIAIAIGTLLDSLISVKAGNLMDKFGRRWSALPSLLGMSVGFLCLGLAQDYWMYLFAICLLGAFDGISAGLVLVLAADLAPTGKGKSQFLAVIKLISDAGMTVAPLLISYLLLFSELNTMSFLTFAFGIIAFVYMLFKLEETKEFNS